VVGDPWAENQKSSLMTSPEIQLGLTRLLPQISTENALLDAVDDRQWDFTDRPARAIKQFVFFNGCAGYVLPGSAFALGINT
jgi:hypothetical protein